MPLSLDDQLKLQDLAIHLQESRRILFITGAGISADSGIPTYRGIGGLYNDRNTREGVSIEEALSASMFRKNPALTWHHIMQIEKACRGAEPNDAHKVIAAWEKDPHFERVCTLTQNVDGLHLRAGSRDLIDIHGDVHKLMCTSCRWHRNVPYYEALESRPLPPRCPDCDGIVRPEVTLFEESLSVQKIGALEEVIEEGLDAVFTVGTTSVFPYISHPVRWALSRGVPAVEINPGSTHLSGHVTYKITAGAAESLRALSDFVEELR